MPAELEAYLKRMHRLEVPHLECRTECILYWGMHSCGQMYLAGSILVPYLRPCSQLVGARYSDTKAYLSG
eukprot:3911438-Rhodomonas_salina.1